MLMQQTTTKLSFLTDAMTTACIKTEHNQSQFKQRKQEVELLQCQ